MEDENVASFAAITGADPERARQYLQMSENNISDAIELFFNMDGVDLAASAPMPSQNAQAPPVPDTTRPGGGRDVIDIDSDNEVEASGSGQSAAPPTTGDTGLEDDAAMARRLQEELYGAGGSSGGDAGAEGYRAPIAPTRETLVGPDSYDLTDGDDTHAAVLEQLRRRQRAARPGIFNQQGSGSSSIWQESSNDPQRQAALSRSTGGASGRSSKSTMLAEMFRPPFELMSNLSWDDAREEGKEDEKWILVNVQDPSIFDCQLLNRDLWKHDGIKETIKESFIFMQFQKDDPRGNPYVQYYFQERDVDLAYPHIAIVDPRTGEQVKVWSGPPAPKAMDFLMQLHEFLDRYSLSVSAKNPVAKRKPEPKKESKVERMTEDEQLEMALQQSLAGSSSGKEKDADPDDLTRSVGDMKNTADDGDAQMTDVEAEADGHTTNGGDTGSSAFAAISSSNPHTEPPADPSTTTRIRIRSPSSPMVIRRFAVADPVRRIYEWLKAEPLEGMTAGTEFDLVDMGKNLISRLNDTLEQAGLKNATVNLEIVNQ